MTSLLYNSAQDILVTRQDMQHMQTPEALGARHHPYPFADFANTTVQAIESRGFQVKTEEYAVTKDGNRMFGLLEVSNGNQVVPYSHPAQSGPNAWNMLVALRGSHDQRISRGLAIGSQVMVCSNLCFHGDLGTWQTRQTTNINSRIPGLIDDAVSGLHKATRELTVDFDSFNQSTLTRDQGDNLLLSIFRDGGFSASQLGRAVNEWDESSVPEHAQNGRNVWWLFNAATQALKPTGANNNHNDLQERSTVVFHHLRGATNARQLVH